MDARRLFQDKLSTFLHLERYVNDGSPSGWTDKNKTSESTNPFTGRESFPLLEFDVSDVENIIVGREHALFERPVNYAHPDSKKSKNLAKAIRTPVSSGLIVSPTSGGRTMLLRNEGNEGCLKLTYESRIGRVDRQLKLQLCQSSIEASEALESALNEGRLHSKFAIQRETGAKVSMLANGNWNYEWGTIFRETRPYPFEDSNRQLVPGFSLFSRDHRNPQDEALINQFIELSGADPRDYLLDLLLLVVDSYWRVVLGCAFHMETHGQNCYFEMDESYRPARFVYKDMDSVEKDIPLARFLGHRTEWESFPVMCFDESLYFYPIRASYMYDFKLGEYLLSPVIQSVEKKYRTKIDVPDIQNTIRAHVKSNYFAELPKEYFPNDGCWYKCDDTERQAGKRREYFANKNPKFR